MVRRSPTAAPPPPATPALYLADETAWLERTADALRDGRPDEVDRESLTDFVESMARSERRAVKSHLAVLLIHLLKWRYQPERRSRSWSDTVGTQREELTDDLRSGTLRNHAVDVLADAYRLARRRAAAEMRLPEDALPKESPRGSRRRDDRSPDRRSRGGRRMTAAPPHDVAPLHETDEVAWLDRVAEAARTDRLSEIDPEALAA